MNKKMRKLEHKTIEAQAQSGLKTMPSALGNQKIRDNLELSELKQNPGIGYDQVGGRLADKKSSKEKPVLAKEKREVVKKYDEAMARFLESQARFTEAKANFDHLMRKRG